jgi:hypothetical protein
VAAPAPQAAPAKPSLMPVVVALAALLLLAVFLVVFFALRG